MHQLKGFVNAKILNIGNSVPLFFVSPLDCLIIYYLFQGVIEIRFVSPNSEARPRTGDKCEMVESLAFFESCRPVLEGLKNMPFWGFPFKVNVICFINFALLGFFTQPYSSAKNRANEIFTSLQELFFCSRVSE